jgi:hypothetical protein
VKTNSATRIGELGDPFKGGESERNCALHPRS